MRYCFPVIFDLEHNENLYPSVTRQIGYKDMHALKSILDILKGVNCLSSSIFSSGKRLELANLFLLESRAFCDW